MRPRAPTVVSRRRGSVMIERRAHLIQLHLMPYLGYELPGSDELRAEQTQYHAVYSVTESKLSSARQTSPTSGDVDTRRLRKTITARRAVCAFTPGVSVSGRAFARVGIDVE